MGRLLNIVAPDPAAAVCRLPQPFRMIDKLVSGIIQSAIDTAVQTESEKLAAEHLRDGTKVRAKDNRLWGRAERRGRGLLDQSITRSGSPFNLILFLSSAQSKRSAASASQTKTFPPGAVCKSNVTNPHTPPLAGALPVRRVRRPRRRHVLRHVQRRCVHTPFPSSHSSTSDKFPPKM